jgi:hypothetical protein
VLGHNPDDEQQRWDTHMDKESARSQLMGKVHDSFPDLDHANALDVAARHMKVGKSPKHDQLAALGALFKSRDNGERGISFGTPFHAVRAAGFQRAVNFHYPDLAHELEHFPEAAVTLISFPGNENLPPQEEAPPEDAGALPPEDLPAEEAPPPEGDQLPQDSDAGGQAPFESRQSGAALVEGSLGARREARVANGPPSYRGDTIGDAIGAYVSARQLSEVRDLATRQAAASAGLAASGIEAPSRLR